MNIITGTLLILCLAGFADSLTGYHLKIGRGFDESFRQYGSLFFSIAGFCCIGAAFVRNHIEIFESMGKYLPFDMSVLPTMILETTMGGYPIARELAADPSMVFFSGILISASLGCLISFQMPVALSMIEKEDIGTMMLGMIPGILMIPAGLLTGGLMMGMHPLTWLINMVPVMIICIFLIIGVFYFPLQTQKIMTGIGLVLKVIAQCLSMLVILNFLFPSLGVVTREEGLDTLLMCLRLTVSIGGGMVLFEIVNVYFRKQAENVARLLGVNTWSVLGLILSVFSPVIMLPVFGRMDRKGKVMNAAFSVMGSYVFGGQMSFVSTVVTGRQLIIFMASKLTAGILGILAGMFMYKKGYI